MFTENDIFCPECNWGSHEPESHILYSMRNVGPHRTTSICKLIPKAVIQKAYKLKINEKVSYARLANYIMEKEFG